MGVSVTCPYCGSSYKLGSVEKCPHCGAEAEKPKVQEKPSTSTRRRTTKKKSG